MLAIPAWLTGRNTDGLPVAIRSYAPGTDEAAVIAGTATPDEVQLTADGFAVDRSGWCTTDGHAAGQWIQYAVWHAVAGRTAHGFTCAAPGCRRILQTG
jgi:hypothetical protein